MSLYLPCMSLLSRQASLWRHVPVLAFFSLFSYHAASATTLNVPASYKTIQAAVNASKNGDTVLVAAGTYSGPGNRDIDFGGKNLTVKSSAGAATTIIDCQGKEYENHRGFYIHKGETTAIVSGLTIKNGYESEVDNTGLGGAGAGIEIDDSSAAVQDCTIINNTGTDYNGGGGVNIYNFSSAGSVTLTNCTISGNIGGETGGVSTVNAYVNGSTATLINCTISSNKCIGYGGGVSNEGQITLIGCTISGNQAGDGGGGVSNFSVSGSAITMTNCVITGNTASYGGGVSNENQFGGKITVTNCTITGNTASPSGDGSGGYGGGVYNSNDNHDSVSITLTNDLVYGNTANNGSEIYSELGASPTVSFSDIQGGYPGNANINTNPLFVNFPTDLHLKANSPCFGEGTHIGAPLTDLDGNFRPNPPSIGAYDVPVLLGVTSTRMISDHMLEIKTKRVFGNQTYKVQVKTTINGKAITTTPQSMTTDVDASGAVTDNSPIDIDLAAQGVTRFKKNQKFTIEADVLDSSNTNVATDKKDAVILLPVVLVPGIGPIESFWDPNRKVNGGDGTWAGLENKLKGDSALLLNNRKLLGDGYSMISDQTTAELSYPTLYTLSYDRNNVSLASGASALAAFLDTTVKKDTWADAVNLVGHSKGALVSRKFVVTQPLVMNVKQLIMCQGPHYGSLVAKLDHPLSGIATVDYQNLYPLWPWMNYESFLGKTTPFIHVPTSSTDLAVLNNQVMPSNIQYEIIYSSSVPTPFTYTQSRSLTHPLGFYITITPGDGIVPDFSQVGYMGNPNLGEPFLQPLIPAFQGTPMIVQEIDGFHAGYMDEPEVGAELFGRFTSDLN